MDRFSALVAVTTIGGVEVAVIPNLSVMPKAPDVEQPDVLWPTSRMALRTSVLMSNGKRWTVSPVPRYNSNGDAVVTLAAPAPSRAYVTITVRASALDVPIWWVGTPPPSQVPVEIPGPGEHSDVPPPQPPEPLVSV
jgi:hypothetical protein